MATASIVIPAHNEESVIGDLLAGLGAQPPGRFEIIVVCNGCTDDTAAVARRQAPEVTVIEIAEASKRLALIEGDEAATSFPRLYVDADVQLTAASVDLLVAALSNGRLLAVAPERRVPRDGVSVWVRWYYDVWEQLPQVRAGLFGRGVIALSERGNARVRSLPALMGDDLIASEAFSPSERAIVPGAEVIVWPPRTLGDLLRRRVRAATGNAEADSAGLRSSTSVTSWGVLSEMARGKPSLIPKMLVFVGVGVASRIRARRAIREGDSTTWLRDDSSRVRTPALRADDEHRSDVVSVSDRRPAFEAPASEMVATRSGSP